MAKIDLPPRYEVRTLGKEHEVWASAIIYHSFVHSNKLWAELYPEKDKTLRIYSAVVAGQAIVSHQARSGLSLGIFDKEYRFKRPESEKTGGKLYWDFLNTDATRQELLDQMDFPLVSVAMAFDLYDPPTQILVDATIRALPPAEKIFSILEGRDGRDPKVWEATGPGQVLMRFATATREDATGLKLMKTMAHYMMHKAAEDGFRAIDIECFSPAVHHVWANPPSPFKGNLISEVDVYNYEEENDEGTKVYPMRPANARVTKVYVELK